MALPVFPAGTKVRASQLNALVTELQNLFKDEVKISKFATTTRNSAGSGATLTADPHLLTALEANTTYDFEFRVYSNSPTAADIQFAVGFPAGSSVTWGGLRLVTTATAPGDTDFGVYIAPTSAVSNISAAGTAGDQEQLIHGTIIVGATPGNLTLYWAQGTANASNTTVWARSTMTVRRYRAAP